ncbi:MAG: serine/threonine protein kinase, partial [Bradymonadaceae bacterium]
LFTKVIDFGIAKAFAPEIWDGQTLTRTGRMVGTPSYMAPEQIRGSSVDSRTDQYAAAVLTHYLASGRKPVEGPGPMETVANQLREPPSPLSDHVSDLSAGSDLEAVLLKALSKDPAHRFGSIDAFSTAVSEAVASRSGRRERAAPTAEDRTPEPIEATGSSGRTTGAELAAVPASLLEPIDGRDSVADPTVDGEAAPPTAPTESERGPDPDEFATAAASDPPALPGTGNAPSAPAPGTAADGGGGGEVGRHSLAAVVGGMAFLGVIAGAAAHWLDRPRPANERAGASASLSGGGTDAGQTPADGSARAHAANAGETTAGTGRVESTLGGQPADAGREPKGDGSFRAVETGRRAGGATQRSDTAGEAGRADDGRSVGSTAS